MTRQIFDNSTELGINQTTVKLQSLPEKRAAAVRAVCGLAKNATEAAEVLEALGLDPVEGKAQASP